MRLVIVSAHPGRSGDHARPFLSAIVALVVFLSSSVGLADKAWAVVPPSGQADRVIVFKEKRVLILFRDGEILKTYRIALGRQPKGHKTRTGDNRTPEGNYVLDFRNPNSNYYLALHVSYPNDADIQYSQRLGVSPGGDIMIHGLSNGMRKLGKYHRYLNWTNGCIALTDLEMEEIWTLVLDGTPIEIKP